MACRVTVVASGGRLGRLSYRPVRRRCQSGQYNYVVALIISMLSILCSFPIVHFGIISYRMELLEDAATSGTPAKNIQASVTLTEPTEEYYALQR